MKKRMDNVTVVKKYIVGIIKDHNITVGFKLWDPINQWGLKESKDEAFREIVEGKAKIIGLQKFQGNYWKADNTIEKREYPRLQRMWYPTQKLPVYDLKGELLKEGIPACVGKTGNGEFVVVDGDFKVRIITEEQAKQEEIVGIIIKKEGTVTLYNKCKNYFFN